MEKIQKILSETESKLIQSMNDGTEMLKKQQQDAERIIELEEKIREQDKNIREYKEHINGKVEIIMNKT